MNESSEQVSSNEEELEVRLKPGQIGYVDKHGTVHTFDTPGQLAEYKEEENNRDNR